MLAEYDLLHALLYYEFVLPANSAAARRRRAGNALQDLRLHRLLVRTGYASMAGFCGGVRVVGCMDEIRQL